MANIFAPTGKKIVDLLLWTVILFAIMVGIFYFAGLITFTWDTNDLMYMGIAFVVGLVIAFILNKIMGSKGGSQPNQQQQAPAQPQQPAPQQPPAQPPPQPAPQPAPAQ